MWTNFDLQSNSNGAVRHKQHNVDDGWWARSGRVRAAVFWIVDENMGKEMLFSLVLSQKKKRKEEYPNL